MFRIIGLWITAVVALSSCGVKGPPLPPEAEIPAQHDDDIFSRPSPTPRPNSH